MPNTTGSTPTQQSISEASVNHQLTVNYRFLPQAIKPSRFLALQWPNYREADESCELVSLLSGASYEKRANDPFLTAIAESISQSGCFRLGRAFAVPAEALAKLNEHKCKPFVSPQLTPLCDSALIVVALDRYNDLAETYRQLTLAGVVLDSSDNESQGKHSPSALIAVVQEESYPPFLDKLFDVVVTLHSFQQRLSSAKSVSEILSMPIAQESDTAIGKCFFPNQPASPLTEVSFERARLSFSIQPFSVQPLKSAGSDDSDISAIGQDISAALKQSGQTEFQLENCNRFSSEIDLGDLLATINLGIPSFITGVTLSQLSAFQINARLLASLKRYRRSRLELSATTLSPACADSCGEHFVSLLQPLQSVFGIPDVHCKLVVRLGFPVDSEVEVAETIESIRAIAKIIDRKRGLKIRFVRYMPNPASSQIHEQQLSVTECLERYQSIIAQARVKGVSFSLADQYSEMFTLALYRNLWSDAKQFRGFCQRRESAKPSESARWLDLLVAEDGIDRILEPTATGEGQAERKEEKQTAALVTSFRPTSETNLPTQTTQSFSVFGRSKKRSARQTVAAPTMGRVRFTWSKSGAARFLSHLDNLRTIESALRRAGLNVTYTQGKKPRMKLSFGPPLPVGFSSESELFDVFFETAPPANELVEILNHALPDGFAILAAESVYTKAPSALEEIKAAEYIVALECTSPSEVQRAQEKLAQVIASESLVYVRKRKGREKTINLRPGLFSGEIITEVQELNLLSDLPALSELENLLVIKLSLVLTDTFYVRPEEFLRACDLLDSASTPALIHRLSLQTTPQRPLPVMV